MSENYVLIVDDDELIAKSLCHWLTESGVDCDVACDGQSAETFARHGHYSLIVIDPYLTGGMAEGLATLRQLQPHARFIVVTGYATPQLTSAAASGELTLVEKPQPIAILGRLVTGALANIRQSSPAQWND